MFKFFKQKKPVSVPSYFDYSSAEKKKIIKEATRESNKLQLALVKKYSNEILK
jgi:aminoglycoside phosphotransferase family enzyme